MHGLSLPKSSPRRVRGIVLPVVLVMLVLMTIVVLFLTRRGVVDEQLAANVRGVVTMETAAQYVLRWCERWIWLSPPGFAPAAGRPTPPRFMPAPAAGDPPAWRDNNNWTNAGITLPPGALGASANLTGARCLIEDARGELAVAEVPSGQDGTLVLERTERKFRITAEVEGTGPNANRFARAQSEVRMDLN